MQDGRVFFVGTMQFHSRREEVEVSVAEELGDAEGEPGALHGTQAGQCNASQL